MSATVTSTITETTFRIGLDPLLELWDHRLVEAVTVRVRRPENKWSYTVFFSDDTQRTYRGLASLDQHLPDVALLVTHAMSAEKLRQAR